MKRMQYIFLLTKYIKNYTGLLWLSIVIHALYKCMPIFLGFETAFVLAKALHGALSHPQIHFFIVVTMVLLTALLNYLDIFVSHDTAYRILTELRNCAYDKMAEIAPAGLQNEKSGNIMSIVLEDVELLEWFYAHSIIQIFVAVLLPCAALIVLGMFSVWISIILVLFIFLLCLVPYVKKKFSDLQGQAVQSALGELNAVIIDGIQGLKDALTFQWQKEYFKRLYKKNDRYNDVLGDYFKRSAGEIAAINLIIGLSTLSSATAIIYFAYLGAYSVDWVLPLISLSTMVYIPLQETLTMSSNYGRIFASAKRLFSFLQMKAAVMDTGQNSYEDVLKQNAHTLMFENVSFGYKDLDGKNTVLKNISFTVHENETVVLVGKSGCGKSTCINLLQRFWDVDSGSIKLNGMNIKDISLSALRDLITVVPQEVYLFNKSIEENLKLAHPSACRKDIEDALKHAHADVFVKNLEYGIDTVVGEKGTKLSGGEKQRIALAQAFLKNAPILVLDEITAHLDYYNEKSINDALYHLKKGKITVMAAHRLSTIKSADKIIFIQNGLCAGIGSYDELMEKNSDFRTTVGAASC